MLLLTGISLAVVSGDYSLSRCASFSMWWLLYWKHEPQGTRASVVVAPGPQSTGSIVVVHGLACSVEHGIFPDQGSNSCLLHWQADSLPLSHQGSPWASSHSWSMRVLFCQACCKEVPPTGWLKPQKCIFLKFWRLEI